MKPCTQNILCCIYQPFHFQFAQLQSFLRQSHTLHAQSSPDLQYHNYTRHKSKWWVNHHLFLNSQMEWRESCEMYLALPTPMTLLWDSCKAFSSTHGRGEHKVVNFLRT